MMKKNIIKKSIVLTVALMLALQPAAAKALVDTNNTNTQTTFMGSLSTKLSALIASIKNFNATTLSPLAKKTGQNIKTGVTTGVTAVTDWTHKGVETVKRNPWPTFGVAAIMGAVGLGWLLYNKLSKMKFVSTNENDDESDLTNIPNQPKIVIEKQSENVKKEEFETPKNIAFALKHFVEKAKNRKLDVSNAVQNSNKLLQPTFLPESKNSNSFIKNIEPINTKKVLVVEHEEENENLEQTNNNNYLDFTNLQQSNAENKILPADGDQEKINYIIEQKKNSKVEYPIEKDINDPLGSTDDVVTHQDLSNLGNERIEEQNIREKEKTEKEKTEINSILAQELDLPTEDEIVEGMGKNQKKTAIHNLITKCFDNLKNSDPLVQKLVKSQPDKLFDLWNDTLKQLATKDVTRVDEFFTALSKTNLIADFLMKPFKQWLYLKLLRTSMETWPNNTTQQKYWEDQCNQKEFLEDVEFKGMFEKLLQEKAEEAIKKLSKLLPKENEKQEELNKKLEEIEKQEKLNKLLEEGKRKQPLVEKNNEMIEEELKKHEENELTEESLKNSRKEAQKEEILNTSQPIYKNLDLIKIEKQPEQQKVEENKTDSNLNLHNKQHEKPLPQVPVKKTAQEKLNDQLLEAMAAADTAAITNLIKAGAAKDLMVPDVTDEKNMRKISAIYCAGTIPAIYCLVKNGYAIPPVNADLAEDADFALLREFTQKDMATFVKDSLSGEQDEEFMADWTKILDLLVWQDVTKVDEFFTALQNAKLAAQLLQAPAKQWLYLKLLQTCMEGCPNDAAQQKYWEDQCSKQEFIKDEEFKGMLEATTNKVYILEAKDANDVKELEEANINALAEKIREPLKNIKKALKDLEASSTEKVERECCKKIWENVTAMGTELKMADNIGEDVEGLKKKLGVGESMLGSTMLRQSAIRNSILKNSIIKPNLTATIFLHPENKTKNQTVQQFASMIYEKILTRMAAIMQKKRIEVKNNPLAKNIRKLKTVAPNNKVDWKQAAFKPLIDVANKFDAVEDEAEDLETSSIIEEPKNLEIKEKVQEKILEKTLAEKMVIKPVNTTTSANLNNKPAVKISPLLQKIMAVYEKKPQAPTQHELTLEKEKNFQKQNPQFINTKTENTFEGESGKDQGRKDEQFEEFKINPKLNPLGTLREAMEQLAARNHHNNDDEEADSDYDSDGEDKKVDELTKSVFDNTKIEQKIKLKKSSPLKSQALLNMQLIFGATAGQLYQIDKKTK